MQVTLHFDACTYIFSSMHVFNSMQEYLIQCMYIQSNACILLNQIYPASELSPEPSLIVTDTGKETCASLSIITSCYLSRPIDSKNSYLLGDYSIIIAPGYSIAYALIK